MSRDQVFISYSHKDKKWRDELETHLKPYLRNGTISSWSDQQIAPGSQWFAEIQSALTKSKIAVQLVSPDFFASDFIHEHELGPLLKKAEQGGVKILWIPVRSSAYKQTPLKNYQAIIDPSKPLAGMPKAKRDRAWVEICENIQKEVNRTDEPRPTNLEHPNPPAQPTPTAAGQVLSPAGRIPPSSSSQPVLEWRDSLIHNYQGTPPAIYTQAIEFSAKNVSNRPVQLELAHFTSAITNDTIEAKVVTTVGLLNPSETTPIVPGSSVTLRAEFNSPGGLLAQEFIKVWGKMVLQIKYDGVIHQIPIGENMTQNMFTSFQPNPLEATVTRAATEQSPEPPGPATENDSAIERQFFELLSELPKLLPERDAVTLRRNSAVLAQILRIYFREARRLGLNREEILHDLAKHHLKAHVPPGERFKRRDFLGALENLRPRVSQKLRPTLDQTLRARLSDEQRRLIILQAAYDQDIQELTFLGATGVVSDVLDEMPDLVNFLVQNFPRDPV